MGKRIRIIPLLALVMCAGISLSSGLYYYDVNEYTYLIPLCIFAVSYYVLRCFFDPEKRDKICLGVLGTFLLLMGIVLWSALKPGFCEMLQTISIRMARSYGVSIGNWEDGEIRLVGLAVCYLLCIITVVSLYLYETKKPLVVIALPSFLLFIVSIIADGVPYGKCLVAYGMALIIFL